MSGWKFEARETTWGTPWWAKGLPARIPEQSQANGMPIKAANLSDSIHLQHTHTAESRTSRVRCVVARVRGMKAAIALHACPLLCKCNLSIAKRCSRRSLSSFWTSACRLSARTQTSRWVVEASAEASGSDEFAYVLAGDLAALSDGFLEDTFLTETSTWRQSQRRSHSRLVRNMPPRSTPPTPLNTPLNASPRQALRVEANCSVSS